MDINPAWISVPISLLALGVSAASWWHNRATYGDKRYGEIAALRSQLLHRLLKLIERQRDLEDALDEAELILRRMDDPPRKDIYRRTRGVEEFVESQTQTNQLWEIIERFTPDTHNTSQHLRYLQSVAHTVALAEADTDGLDRIAKRRIEMIRTGGASSRKTVGEMIECEVERQKELGNANPTEIEIDHPTELE
jgi:hypothetical protein